MKNKKTNGIKPLTLLQEGDLLYDNEESGFHKVLFVQKTKDGNHLVSLSREVFDLNDLENEFNEFLDVFTLSELFGERIGGRFSICSSDGSH